MHCTAGMSALAGVLVIGRRKIVGESGPHNVAYVALGTGLLWFGWFGFNGGSALAANGDAAMVRSHSHLNLHLQLHRHG